MAASDIPSVLRGGNNRPVLHINLHGGVTMAKTITSRPSIFGWTNHYDEHGKKIGESRPSIFGGVNHYDASGKKVGHSYPGIISDEVHYDTHGHRVGHSMTGITGYKNHYDEHGHKIGYTRDNLFFGETTKLKDKR